MHVQYQVNRPLLRACTVSLKIVEICSNFPNKKMYFYRIFELFQISQNVKGLREVILQDAADISMTHLV